MNGIDATAAARRAYVNAIASGAKPHIAFDLACAAYRVAFPNMKKDRLHASVSHALVHELKHLANAFD